MRFVCASCPTQGYTPEQGPAQSDSLLVPSKEAKHQDIASHSRIVPSSESQQRSPDVRSVPDMQGLDLPGFWKDAADRGPSVSSSTPRSLKLRTHRETESSFTPNNPATCPWEMPIIKASIAMNTRWRRNASKTPLLVTRRCQNSFSNCWGFLCVGGIILRPALRRSHRHTRVVVRSLWLFSRSSTPVSQVQHDYDIILLTHQYYNMITSMAAHVTSMARYLRLLEPTLILKSFLLKRVALV